MKEVTPPELLAVLPPYRDEWVLVRNTQGVDDIISDVVDKHKEFAPYYDQIALFFEGGTVQETADELYRFCKRYLRYQEEPEEEQTTSLPTGLLVRGHCDCKGYAGFCAGVLDALRRRGAQLRWAYRFASYDPLDRTPHHVFCVAWDEDGREIWIDPTPKARDLDPFWYLDKTVRTMALLSNIGATSRHYGRAASVGIASETVSPRVDAVPNLNFPGSSQWTGASPWPHYLGLDKYRDYYGDRSINEAAVAQSLNAAIAKGPSPGHTVTADFVKWVYDNSIRSYNFYFPGGVDPNFDVNQWLPASFTWVNSSGKSQTISNPPKLVFTADGRVTFTHDQPLDDYRNWLIQLYTAGAQNYINHYDASPFPLKPADVKNFSQAYTGNPGNVKASLLKEWRGQGFLTDVGKALEKTVNVVKDAVLKITGAIPRNAFLSLVGLNVFHLATDLWNGIANGKEASLKNTWENLGGNYDKLKSTIEHGAKVPAITSDQQTIDVDPAQNTIGVVQVAAVIAAAMPVLMVLLKFIDKSGAMSSSLQTGVAALNKQFPGSNFTLSGGQLYQNGQPVSWQVPATSNENSPYYNPAAGSTKPLLFGGVAAVGTYLLLRRKPQDKRILFAVLVGGGVFFLTKKFLPPPAPVVPLLPPVNQLPSTQTPGILPSILQALPGVYQAVTSGNGSEDSASGDYFSGDPSGYDPALSDGGYTDSEAFQNMV